MIDEAKAHVIVCTCPYLAVRREERKAKKSAHSQEAA